LDIVIGRDHAIYVNREATSAGEGTWNGFERIVRACTLTFLNCIPLVISDPVVVAKFGLSANDHLDQINVFVIGADHALYHVTQVGANSDSWAFERLGGYVTGDPGTGFFSPSTGGLVLELFVVGSDKAL